MKRRNIGGIRVLTGLALVLAAGNPVRAQNAAFVQTLKENRFALTVHDEKLAGSGADVLRRAMADAHFVMLGEDHGIEQIPSLAAAVCAEIAPRGFHHLALEIGPSVAPQLQRFARASDGAAQLAAFDKQYPETIAFYNWREEFAFLQACAKAAAPLEFWGLDQELMGSPGYLLGRILDTKPGPKAQAALKTLLRENNEDHEAAAKTGKFEALFLTKAKQEELEAARELLQKAGNAEAQSLFASLLESRDIYVKQMGPTPYVSNRQRAILMKKDFVENATEAAQKEGGLPKVFFKFGAWHLYRGINPLHSSEVGNLIAEAAEGHSLKTVNILVLGVKGEQLRFAGIGKPAQPSPLDLMGDKDSDFRFLAPFFDSLIENLWTLFDLRTFRDHFGKYGRLDPEMERLIFGYDFLVLIPDPKPEHPVP